MSEYSWVHGLPEGDFKAFYNPNAGLLERLLRIFSNKGVVNIEHESPSKTHLMITSHGKTHNPLFGPAYSVSFTDGKVSGVYKSALSLWPVHGKEEQRIAEHVIKSVDHLRYE